MLVAHSMGGLVARRAVESLSTGNIRRVFPADTYATMLAEDFTPAASRRQGRSSRPWPRPSTSSARSRRGNQHLIAEHQRRYVETLPDGRFEEVDSSHFIRAEQPGIVADRVRHLLDRASRTDAPGPLDRSPPPGQSDGQRAGGSRPD